MFSFNLKRFCIYKIRKFFLKKPNYRLDDNFEFVKNLRKYGLSKKNQFYKENSLASEIIKTFDKISDKKLTKFLSDDRKNKTRYSYRSSITHFFDKKLLYDYANQNIFIDNFKQYFGLEPKIRMISVWIDYPNIGEKKNSQLFHRDYDDVFLVKTFLCLTNVKKENGPFQFLLKSHLSPWINKLNIMKNPLSSLIAKKGDLYMADTNGFHKGKKLIRGFRCLLNVQYVSDRPMTGFSKKIIN